MKITTEDIKFTIRYPDGTETEITGFIDGDFTKINSGEKRLLPISKDDKLKEQESWWEV